MKRYFAAAVVACAVLAVPAFGAPTTSDTNGPGCRDVTGGSGTYISGTVNVLADLAEAPCKQITYTLSVYTDASAATLITSATAYTVIPSATPQIGFSIPNVAEADGVVCVALTTSSGGKKVFDAAPDVDNPNGPCMSVSSSGSGFSGFS